MQTNLLKPLVIAVMCSASTWACGGSNGDGGTTSTPTAATTDPYSCEVVQSLVIDKKGTPPTTFDDFIKFPRECRHAIFSVLTPEARAGLWQEHFDRYLQEHPALTDRQRAVIERAKAMMRPEIYTASPGTPADDKLNEQFGILERETIEQFGKLEGSLLMGQVGPVAAARAAIEANR